MARIRTGHILKENRVDDIVVGLPLRGDVAEEILSILELKPKSESAESTIRKLNYALCTYSNRLDDLADTMSVADQKKGLKSLMGSAEKLSERLQALDSDSWVLLNQCMKESGWPSADLDRLLPLTALDEGLEKVVSMVNQLLDGPELKTSKGSEPDKQFLFPLIATCGEIWKHSYGMGVNEGSAGKRTSVGNITFSNFVHRLATKINSTLLEDDVKKSIKAYMQKNRR